MKPVFIRAPCSTPGCGHERVFRSELDYADTKRAEQRILVAAGWLRVAGEWACDRCSQMMRDALGRMSTANERAVRAAIADALYLGRPEVIG